MIRRQVARLGAGLALAGAGPALLLHGANPPRITHSFPVSAEPRDPDRTLAKTTHGAADLIAYSPDGRMLASGGIDKVVRVWDARTGDDGNGALLQSLTHGSIASIAAIHFSADGNTLVTVAEDQTVTLWNPKTGSSSKSTTTKAVPHNIVFRPGPAPQFGESTGDGVKLWNYETDQVVRTFSNDGQTIRTIAFTPDGNTLAGVTRTGGIRLWNAESGELIRTIETRQPIVAITLSATHVAAGALHGGIGVWSLEGGEPRTFTAQFPVAFNPQGDQLAGTSDKLIGVWDLPSGALLCFQEGHAADIAAIAFNSNGQKMASSDFEGHVNYWTVPLPPLPAEDVAKIKAALPPKATAAPKKPRRLLVFWRADAILHKAGVPAANLALKLMGEQTGAYTADYSRDYAALDPKVLADYDAIVLNSTAHLAIPEPAKRALLRYARDGGGVIGIHAAIDTFKNWLDGASIIGATFGGHPWGPTGTWAIKVEDPAHPLTRAFGGRDFKIHDELYEMAEPYTRLDRRVLLSLDVSDPATAQPGAEPLHRSDRDFAVAWIKRAGAGRVFYGGFGHLAEPFEDPAILRFYLDGIQFVLGDLEISPLDELPRS